MAGEPGIGRVGAAAAVLADAKMHVRPVERDRQIAVLVEFVGADTPGRTRQISNRAHPDLFGGMRYPIELVHSGEADALHYLRVGPMGDARRVRSLCAALRKRNVDCLIVKTLAAAA